MKIYEDMVQQTDEWFEVKLGKISASQFHLFFGESTTKDTIIDNLASERICGKRSDSKSFSNVQTERGNEKEPEARRAYELHTFNIVKEVGFVELNKNIGCSPDGLVGEYGMIEIKCKDTHTFFKQIRKGIESLEPIYKTQIQFNLWVLNRKWCDYVCYNENYDKVFVQRIYRDDKRFLGKKGFFTIAQIKEKALEINLEIEQRISQFKLKY